MSLTRRHFLHTATVSPLLALGTCGEERQANPFLQGEFAPVHEETAADNLKIIGALPKELDGMFVRNGPNPQFTPKGNYHWFDGDGMLHGVRLRDGKASYRNRYVRTEKYLKEQKAGRALLGSILDKPNFAAPSLPGNTANTALVWHGGKFLALWEAGPPHAIKLPELTTIGPHDFQGVLKQPFTAHPKIDPESGEMLYFGYASFKPYLRFGIANSKGEIVHSTAVDIPRPVMMHDFAVTKKYAVFMDLPATFDIMRASKGGPVIDFEPKHGARIGLLPRAGSNVKWFDIAPCYVFHTLNAYDDGEDVVLLACRYAQLPDIFPANGKIDLARMSQACLHRWRISPQTGLVKAEQLDDNFTDFPRVNEGMATRRTRYGFAAQTEKLNITGLIKYDFDNGTSLRHFHGDGRFGGEGVFVPRNDSKREDDGWLMTFVHDRSAGRSELIIIEARDFQAPPIARVLLPQRVPYGFHGAWVDARKFA